MTLLEVAADHRQRMLAALERAMERGYSLAECRRFAAETQQIIAMTYRTRAIAREQKRREGRQ